MNYSSTGIKKKQLELSSHKIKMSSKVLVYAFKISMIIFLFASVTIICVGAGSVTGIIETAPKITLNDVTPSQYKTTVYDCNNIQTETLVASGANRIDVSIDKVPANLQNAFIAIEDERFYSHNGIDAKGIIRAAYIGLKNNFRFTQGASTITQQLIKNSVFAVENEDSLGDRLKRKIQEQYLALQLEDIANKSEILENYLNIINLGNNNLGVQSASHNYFNKDVSELTLSECAVIAAITQNPSKYNPIRHPDNNKVRRKLVLDNMLSQKMITQEEYDEAINDAVYDRITNINSTSASSTAYSYYTDALIQDIMNDLIELKGYTYTQAYNLVYRGGLSIYACEDSALQKYAEDTVNNPEMWHGYLEYSLIYRLQVKGSDGTLSKYTEGAMLAYLQKVHGSNFDLLFSSKEEGDAYIEEYRNHILEETGGEIVKNGESATYTMEPQLSLVAIENGTGNVKAIIGGRGSKTQSLILNRATESKRQAGSTIKPLVVYSPAIDTCGYTLASVIDDVPFYYSSGQLVRNNDGVYKGYVPLRYAMAESRNVPAVKTLQSIGLSTGINYLKNYGLTTLTDNDNYLPIALGTCSVTNMEMTAAYTTFANKGQYIKPKLYSQVLDHDGNVILDNTDTKGTQVIKESTAWLMTDALHTVVTDGTLAGMRTNGMYVSAKSGTTQNAYDRWVIGYTSNITIGTWLGYDQNKEYDERFGFPYIDIWNTVMQKANEGLTCKEPDAPSNIVKCEICRDSGLLAVEGLCDCDQRGSRVTTEYFEAGTEPTKACDIHTKVTICGASNQVANDHCPPALTQTVIRIRKNIIDSGLADNPIQDAAYAITDDMLKNKCTTHK